MYAPVHSEKKNLRTNINKPKQSYFTLASCFPINQSKKNSKTTKHIVINYLNSRVSLREKKSFSSLIEIFGANLIYNETLCKLSIVKRRAGTKT